MKMSVNKYEQTLLSEFLNFIKHKFNDEKDISLWMYIAVISLKKLDFSKKLLKIIKKKESVGNYTDVMQCVYENEGKYSLKIINSDIRTYDIDTIETILLMIISVVEPILPLGTVVKLKKESMESIVKYINNDNRYDKQVSIEEVSDTELIIDKRFIDLGKDGKYAEYSASIYPMSATEKMPQFIFTNADIDEVLHKGYSNEKEESYVCLMKSQLIKDGKISISTI